MESFESKIITLTYLSSKDIHLSKSSTALTHSINLIKQIPLLQKYLAPSGFLLVALTNYFIY